MKFRNQFLKYQMQTNEPAASDDSGTGGGGGWDETPAGDQTSDNSQNNDAGFANLWDNSDNAEAGEQAPQQQAPVGSAESIFNDHVQTLGFGAEATAMYDAMESRNPEAMQKAIHEMQTSTYRAAMIDVNKLVNQRVDNAMSEMQASTNNTIEANSIVAQMETALPWTREPAYSPMARAVVNQMLTKPGFTPEKAIAETSKYFQKFATDAAAGQQNPPNGKPNGGFQNPQSRQQQNNNQADDAVDWIDFLGGKPE